MGFFVMGSDGESPSTRKKLRIWTSFLSTSASVTVRKYRSRSLISSRMTFDPLIDWNNVRSVYMSGMPQ